mmetsp:Transcript_35742/g.91906  ORF Transcript_35742/g.91906 Transcript_35742/m.91906 type:complete len:322 (-) Transcript_35742:39-1004(-)
MRAGDRGALPRAGGPDLPHQRAAHGGDALVRSQKDTGPGRRCQGEHLLGRPHGEVAGNRRAGGAAAGARGPEPARVPARHHVPREAGGRARGLEAWYDDAQDRGRTKIVHPRRGAVAGHGAPREHLRLAVAVLPVEGRGGGRRRQLHHALAAAQAADRGRRQQPTEGADEGARWRDAVGAAGEGSLVPPRRQRGHAASRALRVAEHILHLAHVVRSLLLAGGLAPGAGRGPASRGLGAGCAVRGAALRRGPALRPTLRSAAWTRAGAPRTADGDGILLKKLPRPEETLCTYVRSLLGPWHGQRLHSPRRGPLRLAARRRLR